MDLITNVANRDVKRPRKITVSRSPECDIVIIGAGPYGLSAASFLKAKGFEIHVFGEPMDFWANMMPQGMLLRSPREASSIADPGAAFTLEAYERASSTESRAPIPLKTFVEYGRWFRNHLGPYVDATPVSLIKREQSHFHIALNNGVSMRSRRVVIAAGVGPFRNKPPVFGDLPSEQSSHCYEGKKIAELAGKRVAVIGAGQSALESAALLFEAGADVEVIAKIPALRWIGSHRWLHQLGIISKALYSKHDVGPVGVSRLVAYPKLVSFIPLTLRDKIRVRAVRPAGAQWLPQRLSAVKITTGRTVHLAQSIRDEVQLKLDDGTERRVDHVLLGTGYDVDIGRYEFLSPKLSGEICRQGGYPKLQAGFQSSVPGLYFIGAAAARSFGPLLYFVAGTQFASKELTKHIY